MPSLPISAAVHVPVLANVKVLPPKGLNTSIYLDLNRLSRHSAWAHGFMHDYALWLGPVLLTVTFFAVYGVIWWRRAARPAGLMILGGAATVAALGLNQLVGHAAQELRPYDSHPTALVLVGKTTDYSFPSDHSVIAGALITAVALLLGGAVWRGWRTATETSGQRGAAVPRPGAVAVGVAANVVFGLFLCFARVYVGAHYPGDVVAGLLLGAVVVAVASLLRPIVYRLADLVEPTVLGVVLCRPSPAAPVAPGPGMAVERRSAV